MCDAVEGVVLGQTEDVPGPEGVGLEAALANYASYFNNTYVPFSKLPASSTRMTYW